MTIFREGFETTLFMQSLILEAGMRAVLIGLASGRCLIAALGFAVFAIGAKLPYRKMLVGDRRPRHLRALYLSRFHRAAFPNGRLAAGTSHTRLRITDLDGRLVRSLSDLGRHADSLLALSLMSELCGLG